MSDDKRIENITNMSIEELVKACAYSIDSIIDIEKRQGESLSIIKDYEDRIVELRQKLTRLSGYMELEKAFYAACFDRMKEIMKEHKTD